jgi:hypothetical protein
MGQRFNISMLHNASVTINWRELVRLCVIKREF